ncbi:MAG: hypothetical protein C4309_14295 [Chloroflexota bacterium]
MRHKLRVSWPWYVLISLAVLILSWLLSHDYLATATFGLAFVTFLLVLETRETRVQAETQRKELAFRAALVELADNILNHRRWDPERGGRPDRYWWDHPPQFTQLNKLLGSVDITPQLFVWITGERGDIQIRDRWLRNELDQQPEGQVNNKLIGRFY